MFKSQRIQKCLCMQSDHLQLPNFRGHEWASMGKSSRCMGHSALTVSLETFRRTCGVKEGKSAQSRDRNMLTVAGKNKNKKNCSIRFCYEQIRKRVQISPDTVQPRVIFPSPTWVALCAPSCRCLFLDSLVKNSMSGHPWRTNLPSISHLAHLWQQYGLRLSLPSPIASKRTKVNVLRSPLQTPGVSVSWFRCQEAFIYLPVCWRPLKCHRLF